MPDYTALDDRAARQIAIAVANQCRAVSRPVTMAETVDGHKRKNHDLLQRAVALGYLTVYKLPSTTLYMPYGWGFGPPKKGCCK